MSLRPDDRSRRSRSKSPGRRHSTSRSHSRSHSHSRVRDPGSRQHYDHGHPYDVDYPNDYSQPGHPAQPYYPPNDPITMGNYADLPPDQRPGYMHQQQQPTYTHSPAVPSHGLSYSYNQQSSQPVTYTANPQAGPPGGGYTYAQPPDKITFTAKPVVNTAPPPSNVRHTATPASPGYPPHVQHQPQYASMSHPPPPPQAPQPPPPQATAQPSFPPPPMGSHSPRPEHHRAPSYPGPATNHDGRRVVEMVPGGAGGGLNAPPSPGMRPHSLSVGGNRPEGLTQRMDRLSVSGNRPDLQTIVPGGMPGGMPGGFPGGSGLPPPSPMLEAYHGVYQSLSPMPQAKMMDDDLDHIPALDSLSPRGSSLAVHGGHSSRHRSRSTSRRSPSPAGRPRHKDKLALEAYGSNGRDRDRDRDRHREKEREKEKRARIYDATGDAQALADALAARTVNPDPIIDILPALSHDQMLELRSEYKRHCKVQGRGINIAKHIKLKTSGNFGKIAYVTALGRYEGEGYWANFWYQSHSARRELLIEALMGRTNFEMREIKASFKDKRYSDSLTRCMDKELKADKFRKAVLMALEAGRQEDSDVWPIEYRNRDADELYRALKTREGGESTMLGIVISRSDLHLRDVLRTYERKYQGSFARDALRKSNNLVGEVITHILNGVMNRPARDAMLMHHALMDLIDPLTPPSSSNNPHSSSSNVSSSSKHERQMRFELLISRLVRLHWDRLHLERVKSEYEDKYGRLLEEDIEEATKGDFREFCLMLCQGR